MKLINISSNDESHKTTLSNQHQLLSTNDFFFLFASNPLQNEKHFQIFSYPNLRIISLIVSQILLQLTGKQTLGLLHSYTMSHFQGYSEIRRFGKFFLWFLTCYWYKKFCYWWIGRSILKKFRKKKWDYWHECDCGKSEASLVSYFVLCIYP